MRLLITIDGGGIRGILPLILLQELQRKLTQDLYTYNPVWWGTSTGAIITSSLAVQSQVPFSVAVQHVLNLYEFRSKSLIRPTSELNPDRGIVQLVKANFSGYTLSDFPSLNIVASKMNNHQPVVFNALNNVALDDAVLASCAFPTIFSPVEIDGAFYVDGFYYAKNPAKLALDTIKDRNGLVVLSLGTGVIRVDDEVERRVKETEAYLSNLAVKDGFTYYRLNPKLIYGADDMQNVSTKNSYNLRKDALLFLEQNRTLISEIADCL